MNTNIHVLIVGGSQSHLEQAEWAIRDREARWSRFLPDSELSLLNGSAGRPVIVARDTFRLVEQAIDAQALTGGAFDPTVLQCLIDAGYDRSFRAGLLESEVATVSAAPTPIGIVLDEHIGAVELPPGVGLDLGGIAKGATADAVVDELMAAGVDGCCVNLGGDLRVGGRGPDPLGWTVELECPGAIGGRQISLAKGAVCTSTITRRRWRNSLGDQHHLRHPATGEPHNTGLVSVSVIAARATQAEVLTKEAFAAGLHGAQAVLEARGVTGVLISDTGEIVELAGFRAFDLDVAGSASCE